MTKDTPNPALEKNPELPGMTLSGAFLDDVDFLEGTSMSMLSSIGTLDERGIKVLVPFVVAKVRGSKLNEDLPSDLLLSVTLTLEDACYLVSDLGGELAIAMNDLKVMSRGVNKLERNRLELVRQYLGKASEAISDCEKVLGELDSI